VLALGSLQEVLRNDPQIGALPTLSQCEILFEVNNLRFVVCTGPEITVEEQPGPIARCDFSLEISQVDWERYVMQPPPPRFTTSQAIIANVGDHVVVGNTTQWARYAPLVDLILRALRGLVDPKIEAPQLPAESAITGRYCAITVAQRDYRIYYESAGEGVPLLFLHTAGGDSRQFKHLLESRELQSKWHMIAFDLPWHGRSAPPTDWRSTKYELRLDWYVEVIQQLTRAIGLRTPVLLGCSMGGSIGLYLASRHGTDYRAVIALEGGLGNPRRRVEWTNHIEVDHGLFSAGWVSGLMSPHSPVDLKDQILWEYCQSGPGVYHGDIYFYAVEMPKVAASLGKAQCPLYVFSGEYDYSASPEMSRAAAEQLGGELFVMDGMGHFPMSEDPDRLLSHLRPVLESIAGFGGGE
jgi:pimeloyl-ACP methyl ester carboxylesterase